MLGAFIGSNKFGFIGIMVFGAVVLGLWAWLVTVRAIPLSPSAEIVMPLLFLCYFLFFWRASRRSAIPATKDLRVPKVLWGAVAVYGTALGVAIIYFIYVPSALSASQVAIGVFLTGYFWYLTHRIRKSKATRGNVRTDETLH